MCLLTRQLLPRRAKKPITVYKVVYKVHNHYFTPFKHVQIKLKDRIIADGPLKGCPRLNANSEYSINTVGEGYIHAYKDFKDAKEWCRFVNLSKTYKFKVIVCIIEPGTLYYANDSEICARSLTTKGVAY
jgi:hypothetical protein